MIGQQIGKFKIERLLGAGGMGEVYLAIDTMLNRKIAIKFLPKDLESRDRVVKRFMREAQASARLTHPNIATLYDVGVFENRHYILMEYVDGEPLSRIMRRDKLEIKIGVRYAVQIAEALAEAHEHGVLHRDIKPGNVLITKKNQVKVLDFGLAKFIDGDNIIITGPLSNPSSTTAGTGIKNERTTDELTREGVLVGTPRYMSPEQILGRQVDMRSDVFAYGILLYEMFTGQHPFKVENNSQLVVAISTEQPPLIKNIAPDVPDELIAVIMKALEKQPEFRYQTVRQMADELRTLAIRLFADHYFDYSGAEDFRSDIPNQRSSIPPANITPNVNPEKKTVAPDPDTTVNIDPKTERTRIMRSSQIILAVVIVVLLLGGTSYLYWALKMRNRPSFSSTRPLIAVMYFDNFTNDPQMEWLGRGLTEMLTTDLAQVRSIEVVSKQRLFDTLQMLGKQDALSMDRNIASEVARKVGAEAILSGSVLKINSKLRLNVRLEEISTGKVIISDVIEGNSIDEIFTLVDAITAKVSRFYNPEDTNEDTPKLGQVTTNSVEAFRLYNRGLERCWLTNFDEGLDDLERSVEIDDQFALAHLQIGNAKFVRNDTNGARVAFDKALKYIDRAGYREQMLIRGVNDYYKGYDTGDYAPAVAIFNQMEANYPKDKEVYLWLGLCQWRIGEYKRAINYYKRILDLDPDFNEMYVALAQAYADDEDYISAVAAMRKTLAFHSGQPDGHNLLGNIYMRMGRVEDAIIEYNTMKSIKKEYRDFRALLDLGQAYIIKGDKEQGKELLNEYLDASSDAAGVVWAHLALFREAFGQGNSVAAQNHLNGALKAAQESKNVSAETLVRCYQSDFYLFLGRKDEALQAAKDALIIAGLDTGGREACQQLALTFLELGDNNSAINSIDSFFKKAGDTKSSVDVRRIIDGAIAYRAGDYNRSRELWAVPLKYNIHMFWRYGLALYQTGKLDEAKDQFQRLLIHEGFDPERRGIYWSFQNPEYAVVLANYYMGRISEAKGVREEARQYYEKFIASWAKADFQRPEISDAKNRLANLQ